MSTLDANSSSEDEINSTINHLLDSMKNMENEKLTSKLKLVKLKQERFQALGAVVKTQAILVDKLLQFASKDLKLELHEIDSETRSISEGQRKLSKKKFPLATSNNINIMTPTTSHKKAQARSSSDINSPKVTKPSKDKHLGFQNKADSTTQDPEINSQKLHKNINKIRRSSQNAEFSTRNQHCPVKSPCIPASTYRSIPTKSAASLSTTQAANLNSLSINKDPSGIKLRGTLPEKSAQTKNKRIVCSIGLEEINSTTAKKFKPLHEQPPNIKENHLIDKERLMRNYKIPMLNKARKEEEVTVNHKTSDLNKLRKEEKNTVNNNTFDFNTLRNGEKISLNHKTHNLTKTRREEASTNRFKELFCNKTRREEISKENRKECSFNKLRTEEAATVKNKNPATKKIRKEETLAAAHKESAITQFQKERSTTIRPNKSSDEFRREETTSVTQKNVDRLRKDGIIVNKDCTLNKSRKEDTTTVNHKESILEKLKKTEIFNKARKEKSIENHKDSSLNKIRKEDMLMENNKPVTLIKPDKAKDSINKDYTKKEQQRLKCFNVIQDVLKSVCKDTEPTEKGNEQMDKMDEEIQNGHQETVANIYKEIMQMKQVKRETETDSLYSVKTSLLCINCGYVNDGHKCPITVN